MTQQPLSDEALVKLQRDTFGYFTNETNLRNGLVPDNTRKGAHSSIAAIGLGLAAYPVGVQQNFISREEAVLRVLTTLRFFWNSPHGPEPDVTGYKGFYYHFLEMESGRRAWRSELSTIDSSILIAGALAAATYFNGETQEETEIRSLADNLYQRMDWSWMLGDDAKVVMGWKPEEGFLPWLWEGYNESILLHVLSLASPTHPLSRETYQAFTRSYDWRTIYGREFLYSGPLFIHQLSHIWIDFRGIQDDFMREKGIDYFENSRRATYIQQEYAIRNPNKFRAYGEYTWGVTASDGPGPSTLVIDGIERHFFDYEARGAPFGPDDGTIAPWAAVAALPFAPEIVLPTLQHFNDAYPAVTSKYGFKCSFNPTFNDGNQGERGWISKGYYGLDQGPIVLMIENYRTGFFWELMKRCPYIVDGLRRAGFTGGWL
ncbi:MAG TPA: glucoamylase family protein [Pyrinomonadaceae bacterium]|nr:glucoamylase family protein [Pyrinomonadaceae bacterium]